MSCHTLFQFTPLILEPAILPRTDKTRTADSYQDSYLYDDSDSQGESSDEEQDWERQVKYELQSSADSTNKILKQCEWEKRARLELGGGRCDDSGGDDDDEDEEDDDEVGGGREDSQLVEGEEDDGDDDEKVEEESNQGSNNSKEEKVNENVETVDQMEEARCLRRLYHKNMKQGTFPSERDLFRLQQQYDLKHCIQQATGEVEVCLYAASRRSDGRPVVIKLKRVNRVEKMCREVLVLEALSPHTELGYQQLLAWHQLPENYSIAIVTNYLTNTPILIQLQDMRMADRDALIKSYMYQLLTVLQNLHDERHLVHRDIKMSNILWDGEQEKLTLIDFETALKMDNTTTTKNLYRVCVGTDGFRAPELEALDVIPFVNYTHTVDVYSAGVVMGQLLYGVPECDVNDSGKNSASGFRSRTLHMLRRTPVAVAPASLDLLLSLLQPDPQFRPSAKKALQHRYFTTSPTKKLN